MKDQLIDHPVILFDGVCNLCNGAVQFVIQRDPEAFFRFASLQSSFAQQLMSERGIDTDHFHSFMVYANGEILERSDAAFFIAGKLKGWKWLRAFRIIPRRICNFFYNVIARNRYNLFGRRDECMIPTPELRARFIG